MRSDPIVGRQVLIAEDRAGRPSDFAAAESSGRGAPSSADCPFCVGHEEQTPASLAELVGDDGGWQVRVVPNKFPAVAWGRNVSAASVSTLVPTVLGVASQSPDGAHEVFIESPRHVQDLTDLSLAELVLLFRVYRDRLLHWSQDKRIEHVTIFKNVGSAAGASLEHIHSQLVALPFVPPVVASELAACQKYFVANGICLFCQLLEEELSHRQRLVVDDGQFVAFCAYAGRQPYETWLMPREHSARFELLSNDDLQQLASTLQNIVHRLQNQISPLSYNLILHTAPYRQAEADAYHWHFEIVPRTTQLAGFEWGAGMHINPISPERAAARLREEPRKF